MKQIRLGSYCKFQNKYYELIENINGLCRLIERNNYDETLEKIGFHKYADSVYILDVNPTNIQSAYYVNTYCKYKGFRCKLLGIKNNVAFLNPPVEYQSMSKDYAKHGYDPKLDVNENELNEIWEECKPIEGFKFDVEPIHFIKKNGNVSDAVAN